MKLLIAMLFSVSIFAGTTCSTANGDHRVLIEDNSVELTLPDGSVISLEQQGIGSKDYVTVTVNTNGVRFFTLNKVLKSLLIVKSTKVERLKVTCQK